MKKRLIFVFTALAVSASAADLNGFIDARYGMRFEDDPYESQESLSEIRLRIDGEQYTDAATFRLRADLYYDSVLDESEVDLESGSGPVDVREASVLFSPVYFMDIKAGRQILTWGAGDLLFINDLFPKDWQSFFTGRDEEYLKAPSDALFLSIFPGAVDINIAYMPRFDSDRYISGDRISYWNGMLGSRSGRNAVADPVMPDEWFDDDEVAVRVSRRIGDYTAALYFYDGFWKSPSGMDAKLMRPVFPHLRVYGASARGALGQGIVSLETGYYDSTDDTGGNDAFIPNSEMRYLAGYEQEVVKNLTAGVQSYVEQLIDYDEYEKGLMAGGNARDEFRQLATVRLTQMLMNQNLTVSLFGYYSPTDEDFYLRPKVSYKVSDAWLLTCGGNIFGGEEDFTFFGQFENNSNIYVGSRYSF